MIVGEENPATVLSIAATQRMVLANCIMRKRCDCRAKAEARVVDEMEENESIF